MVKKFVNRLDAGVGAKGWNAILSMCNLQSLLWLFASFLIMRCMILPAANHEVQQLSGISENIEQALVWNSGHFPVTFDLIGERARVRFITTELTAGLLDAFLTFGFCFVLITYVLLKMRLLNSRFKLLLFLPAIGLIADILETAATLRVLSNDHIISNFLCFWICALYVVKWCTFLISICTPVFGFLIGKHKAFGKMF